MIHSLALRPSQIAIFLCIVLTPLGIAAWLGLEVARDEQAVGRQQFQTLLEGRLRDVNSAIERTIGDMERELLERALPAQPDAASGDDPDLTETLRQIRRREPLIHQVFYLDPRRGLVFPPEGPDASADERAFRQRTAAIWRGDAVLYEPPAPAVRGRERTATRAAPGLAPASQDTVHDDSQSAGQDAGPAPGGAARLSRPGTASAPVSQGDSVLGLAELHPSGWLGWHWEEGLHLIFWRRTDSGGVVGAEVERVFLISRIVGKLPVSDIADGRVVLVDSRAHPVHQWGPYEPPADEQPVASAQVTYPLDTWRILHYASPEQVRAFQASSLRINLMLGFAAVALALLSLAFLFYRDYARRMRDAAQRVNFVTQVSHELKTPLTNIRLYAELLEGDTDEDDERARKRLSVIVAESERLSRLINNILAFSRERQSRLEVHKTWIDLDQVVREVLEQFAPALAAKGIVADFQPGAPRPVYADADVVGQIVANLVSNVEKYAADGRRLEVRVAQSGPRATVRVTDHGPGIPAAHGDKVFRPFYRVSDKLADGVTGTGIGLSIARELARRSGGDLALVAGERGACFELVLDSPEAGDSGRPAGAPDQPDRPDTRRETGQETQETQETTP